MDRGEAAGVSDMEINNCLFEIRRLLEKPGEIRRRLQELESVDWRQINQTVYPNEVDIFRRNSLQQHFIRKLSRFGDVRAVSISRLGASVRRSSSLPMLAGSARSANQCQSRRQLKAAIKSAWSRTWCIDRGPLLQ